ncbi:hypothetical protein [Amycolatopsis sp. lyj-90]|uniref:hypothetical protein n=1 Tax=Amycolatopsis sp. lyj-90 TaxID=2789285 RepID=UPI003977F22F
MSRQIHVAPGQRSPLTPLTLVPNEAGKVLDLYSDRGHDVESAADGRVLLRGPRGRLTLTVPPR